MILNNTQTVITRSMFLIFCCVMLTILVSGLQSCKFKNGFIPSARNVEKETYPASSISVGATLEITDELIQRLVPELKNARLMRNDDLEEEYQKRLFVSGRYSFVVEGDFDRNGSRDVAVVGHYQNTVDPKEDTFFLIVSRIGNKIVLTDFTVLQWPRAALAIVKNFRPGVDGIMVLHTIGSDYCFIQYWSGTKYETESCQVYLKIPELDTQMNKIMKK